LFKEAWVRHSHQPNDGSIEGQKTVFAIAKEENDQNNKTGLYGRLHRAMWKGNV